MNGLFSEVVAARTMNTLYIILDILFLCFLLAVLLWNRRYQAAVAGFLGGILYFIVDYGVFYMWLGTRTVEGADPVWFLLWLSMSYGFTNFVWIWVWLDRDGHALEWSLLITSGWLCTALLSQNFGSCFTKISIFRGTSGYHGIMAVFLFVGYAILCLWNIRCQDKQKRAPLLWILSIGILVQFGWEFILTISGIRNQSIATLIVNSLLETNMGLPYLYFIHSAVNRKYGPDLRKKIGTASCRKNALPGL